ncbi:dihydroxyacetone kinase family protein [Corynebacterium sp. sy039]|uniref:dihydroxyacetone kinase family protein n=1 Tax=Corynebacterium sp. sy039 TaxID=2599641 RepID=UPI0011B56500|nr:dihydroxyacetone kinase family protein [Corynebacterium sp. sy039]QDZ42504.1 DAK2 domain-containing protein [Corynebacterium sp. sy039]
MNTSHNQSTASFRNDPAQFLPEALGGFIAGHPDASWHDNGFIGRTSPITTDAGAPAVALVSGGGSGHEPLHAGFLGSGMLSAVCPGLLFTSPNAVQITQATRWADQGAGVVHIVKNYTGDVMNFHVARQATHDVDTAVILVADDVATDLGDDDTRPGRRGTAATILVEKIAGAAAQRGDNLSEVARIGQWVADNSRSMAVALAPGHNPTHGRTTFDLPHGKMEVGVGIHGERGVERVDSKAAQEIVAQLLDDIMRGLELNHDEKELICIVNGLGGTTALELSLIFGCVVEQLAAQGIHLRRALVGSYVTAMNMAGVSITLTRSTDEIIQLLDAPTSAPNWPRVIAGDKEHPIEYSAATMHFDDALPSDGTENTWLSNFISRVQGAISQLSELDRLAGDGDFGDNMAAAFGTIDLPLRGSNADVLEALAQRLFIRAGGTSGAVFGTLFRELAAAMHTAHNDVIGLSTGLSAALNAITELGGAQPGDNTLVDALAPAAHTAKQTQEQGCTNFAQLLEHCYRAATEGAKSTRNMAAKKGRASYVGDAAIGVVDPGAIVMSWLLGGSGKVSDFT